MRPPVLVGARAGVASQEGTYDVQAVKGKCLDYRCLVGARRASAK